MNRAHCPALLAALFLMVGCQNNDNSEPNSPPPRFTMRIREAEANWNLYMKAKELLVRAEVTGLIYPPEEKAQLENVMRVNLNNTLKNTRKAAALYRRSSLPYEMMALCWYHKKEYDQALQAADRAYEIDSTYSHGYVLRGHCYYDMAQAALERNERDKAISLIEDAIPLLEKWIELNPLKIAHIEKEGDNIKLWQWELEELKAQPNR